MSPADGRCVGPRSREVYGDPPPPPASRGRGGRRRGLGSRLLQVTEAVTQGRCRLEPCSHPAGVPLPAAACLGVHNCRAPSWPSHTGPTFTRTLFCAWALSTALVAGTSLGSSVSASSVPKLCSLWAVCLTRRAKLSMACKGHRGWHCPPGTRGSCGNSLGAPPRPARPEGQGPQSNSTRVRGHRQQQHQGQGSQANAQFLGPGVTLSTQY